MVDLSQAHQMCSYLKTKKGKQKMRSDAGTMEGAGFYSAYTKDRREGGSEETAGGLCLTTGHPSHGLW